MTLPSEFRTRPEPFEGPTSRDAELFAERLAPDQPFLQGELTAHWVLGLAEQSPGGLFLQNEQGAYLYVNSSAAAELGCRAEDLIGRTDEGFFSCITYDEICAQNEKVLAGACVSFECVRESEQGRSVTEFTKRPLRTDDGQIIGIVGTSRNVTRQHDELEERNRLIADLERERQLREGLVAGHTPAIAGQ